MRKKTHKKLALDLHEESSDLIYLFCKCKQLFLEKKTRREMFHYWFCVCDISLEFGYVFCGVRLSHIENISH